MSESSKTSAPGIDRATRDLLARAIDLERLEITELAVPQVESFRSAVGVRHERRALFVRWRRSDGAWGIGECSCRPDPFFSGEFLDGARLVLRDHVFPRLPRQGTLGEVVRVLDRVRGWPFTIAAMLDAITDLERRQGRPDLLDAWTGERRSRVPVGISLGLFDSAAAAVERVEKAAGEGYRRIKLKVSPGMKLETLDAIRDHFPDLPIAFDANGSGSADDMGFFRHLAALRPLAIEQPFAPERLDLCLELEGLEPELDICLDESVTGLGTAQTAHRLGVLDELNIKPGRVGGPLATVKILEFCADRQIPAWVGGMFETGVGRLANLRVAARLPAARAHDLSPSSRYFTTDILTAPVRMAADGTVDIGDEAPPEIDEATFSELTVDQLVLTR